MALDINLNGVEATANKSTNVNTDQASNTKYPSVKALYDWAIGLFARATRTISTSSPLSGGGDLSADRTLSISQSNTTTNGYLSSTDWNTFNNKLSTSTAETTYVPYTGATLDVDLGTKEITSGKLHSYGGATVGGNGTGYTNGYIDFNNSSNALSTRLQAGVNTQSITLNLPVANGTVGQNLSLTATNQLGWATPTSGLTSVGLTMPSAFTVSNSPLTSNGILAVSGAGTSSQYVRGDGQLATLPTTTGGGSSVSYYLNGGTSQGTIGGNAYYQMSRTAIIGSGVDFTRTNIQGDGYIAEFITDVADPNKLEIPAGNFNLEFYFNASSSGGTPSFYTELYKYNGTTFTLIATNSATPETITNGTIIDSYYTSLAVPQTTLLITDRLAIRIYVVTSGKTIILHTQDSHLCQMVTTFSTGLSALNGLTNQVQYLAVGTSGSDFAINSVTDTHTFNLPTASATKRGALSSTDWSTFNGKVTSNSAITGATKTKITYDSKGLITSGADATTADIADSTNKRYVTDANLTVIGNTSGTNTGDQTFINARVQSVTSSATVTPTSLNDLVKITAQAAGLTIANPTGTMSEGQALMIRIKDNGTAQTIAFGTNYRAIGVTLPTTTTISKTIYLGCIWNDTDTKFDILGVNIQA